MWTELPSPLSFLFIDSGPSLELASSFAVFYFFLFILCTKSFSKRKKKYIIYDVTSCGKIDAVTVRQRSREEGRIIYLSSLIAVEKVLGKYLFRFK